MRKFGFKIFSTNLYTAPSLIKECAEYALAKDNLFIDKRNDYTSSDAYITMETGKGIMQHNDLWVKDYNYLCSLIE